MNLEAEIRNGYMISSNMKKIWNIQMMMVKHVLDVCNRHKLHIWADGGTLLGAVREHGYIPWDDDIDLLMPREDYDKLVYLSKTEFSTPYFFQCAYTDNEYYHGHAQIRYANTTAILSYDYFKKYNQSIFIDIFCYDSVPDKKDKEWSKKLRRADQIEKILGYNSYRISLYSLFNIKNLFYRSYYLFCNISGKSIKLFKEYEDLFRHLHWEDSHYFGCPAFDRKNSEKTDKNKYWYRETILLPFEDIYLPAPIDYQKVLSKQYGLDYMTPRQAPSLHGGNIIFDSEKNYLEYLPKLRKKKYEDFRKRRIEKIIHLLKFK